jgi:hypothetical protein
MIKKINYKNKTLAYWIKFTNKKGVNFLTPNQISHQIGFLNHPKAHLIKPHKHYKNTRITNFTSEVLIILKGKIRVDFYTTGKKYLFSKIIKKQEVVILLGNHGHGFKVLEPSEIIEVKQGPYNLKKDKKTFDSVKEKKVKIL